MSKILIFCIILLISLLALYSNPQKPQKEVVTEKPVLIREPENPEEKPPAEEFSPFLAEKNVEIGNYYFKKKRYVAAISRYSDAIKYKPNYTDAYKHLARTYEKINQIEDAIATYEKYIGLFPSSDVVDEFKQEVKKLRNKNPKAAKQR